MNGGQGRERRAMDLSATARRGRFHASDQRHGTDYDRVGDTGFSSGFSSFPCDDDLLRSRA